MRVTCWGTRHLVPSLLTHVMEKACFLTIPLNSPSVAQSHRQEIDNGPIHTIIPALVEFLAKVVNFGFVDYFLFQHFLTFSCGAQIFPSPLLVQPHYIFQTIWRTLILFCGATNIPVLDFWWHPPWISKPEWIACLCTSLPACNGFLRFT